MSDNVNALLTCVGRKSYLVGMFERSERLGTLVAVDSDAAATVQYHAPHFRAVPAVIDDADAYVAALLELCEEFDIDCILPQNDLDLVQLADARGRFRDAGVEVAGAPAEVARSVRDKLEMAKWMDEQGLPYPDTWLPSQVPPETFNFIVKSRSGQGGAGFTPSPTRQSLGDLDEDAYVAQQKITGVEYNLDILRSRGGEVVSVVPKRKIEMRWGATHKAESVEAPELVELGVEVGRATGHVGSIDVDVMVSEKTGEMWVIDINPRVGGGYPFTTHFCEDFTDALLAVCAGEEPDPFLGEYRRGVRVDREFRYFETRA